MWYIWLILAGVFLIIEIMTVGFLIFWLSIGSLFAMITSLFTDNIVIQTTVFVISSTILIFVTKPFVKKFGQVQNPISTNFYSIIGKIGMKKKFLLLIIIIFIEKGKIVDVQENNNE